VNLSLAETLRRPRVARVLAVVLLLGVLALVAALVWMLLDERHRAYDETIRSRADMIAGYQRVAANRAQLQAALKRVGELDTSKYYLKASSPSLAAAEIQDAAQLVFDANGVKVNSVNIAPHSDADGRRKATLVFNLRATPEALQKTLYTLEARVPYLFVENLVLRSTINSKRWQPVPNVEPEVQIQFDLAGYAQIGGKK